MNVLFLGINITKNSGTYLYIRLFIIYLHTSFDTMDDSSIFPSVDVGYSSSSIERLSFNTYFNAISETFQIQSISYYRCIVMSFIVSDRIYVVLFPCTK